MLDYILSVLPLYYYSDSISIITVLFYFLFSGSVASLLLFVSYFFGSYFVLQTNDKLSGYECGFDPFNDARDTFYIKFYLVSILFIIFDIEIVFFFPWSVSFGYLSILSFYTMTLFILLLFIGFCYEWRKKVLDFNQ